MNRSFNQWKAVSNARASDFLQPQFRILVLYEDQLSLEQALRLHQHVAQMTSNRLLQTYRWDFETPQGLGALMEAVSIANMIIVTGRGASDLPIEMQAAFDVGLAQRQMEGGALVALLGRQDSSDEAPSPLHFSLQELARRAGLHFFPGVFDLPKQKRPYNFKPMREGQISPMMDRIFRRNISPIGFGINE